MSIRQNCYEARASLVFVLCKGATERDGEAKDVKKVLLTKITAVAS